MCVHLANRFMEVGVGVINCRRNRKSHVPSPAVKAACVSLVPWSSTAHKPQRVG